MCDNELRGTRSCSVMFIYVSNCFIIQVICNAYFVEVMETRRKRKSQAMQVRPYCSGIVVVL